MATPESLITGVDFAYVFTKDYPAVTDFYNRTLGLTCTKTYKRVPGAEYDTGNLTLVVIDTNAHDIEFKPNTHPIALRVEDVSAARARLEAQGVVFKQVLDSGVCHMAFFDDPDGNALMLHQRYDDDD